MAKKRAVGRRIAPRLESGESRRRVHMAAPPGVKHGLALIAESKRISVSYMLEQIMIEVYGNAMRRMGIERPLYIKRKEK